MEPIMQLQYHLKRVSMATSKAFTKSSQVRWESCSSTIYFLVIAKTFTKLGIMPIIKETYRGPSLQALIKTQYTLTPSGTY
ncbi:hypothetical protein EJD97_025534 [Solanum chilense]|uniref:Uncharacterized protein n=1 Tax=Solanum chilense TaxID=4083 RepID=A0A6N2ATA1_SOLCI|nr:hypothetical protein EJD97_025534 [Solanum chilense]